MKAVVNPLKNAEKTITDALEAAWKAAAVWEEVPPAGAAAPAAAVETPAAPSPAR
jgi:hypothetical protein